MANPMAQYAHEQGLSPTRIDYMGFFHPDAAVLAGRNGARRGFM